MIQYNVSTIKILMKQVKYNHVHRIDNGHFASGDGSVEGTRHIGSKPTQGAIQEPSIHPSDSVLRGKQLASLYKKQVDSLSREQKQAITAYTGTMYEPMNDQLRNGTYDSSASLKKKIADATDALNTGSAPVPFTVVRGIELEHPEQMFSEFQNKVGKNFTDPAFVSTTANMGTGIFGNDIKFQIHVPKGAKGLYLGDDVSATVGESEFLIPPGSTFKVASAQTDSSGQRTVVLHLQKAS